MSGARRKCGNGADTSWQWPGRWSIHWMDEATFKVDLEGVNLNDESMEEWDLFMDAQFARRFGEHWETSHQWPSLTAACLNFSRNSLGDRGVFLIMDYLQRRNISVVSLKLFKNGIGDGGASAIGNFLSYSCQAVQEIHLSHNRITELGACSILEAISRSGKYPFQTDGLSSPKSKALRGLTPIWLRLERNLVTWNNIEHRLEQANVWWCTAESREECSNLNDEAPMICMHSSYKSQKLEGISPRSPRSVPDPIQEMDDRVHRSMPIFKSSAPPTPSSNTREDPVAIEHHFNVKPQSVVKEQQMKQEQQLVHQAESTDQAAPKAQDEEGVPLYVFLDASAVIWMVMSEDKLLSFKGLLSLVQQGRVSGLNTKCQAGASQDAERIIFLTTDVVIEQLKMAAAQDTEEAKQLEHFVQAQDSPLQVCRGWGLLEILDTSLHTQMMQLEAQHEQLARGLHISKRSLKVFDFACLWKAQIETEERVLFLTADETLLEFSNKLEGTKPLVALHANDLDQRFASDRVRGCQQLYEAANGHQSASSILPLLSASLLAALVNAPASLNKLEEPSDPTSAAALREELRQAMDLFARAQQHMAANTCFAKGDQSETAGTMVEKAQWLNQVHNAQKRWQSLLARQ